jgi:hypothetical protein
MSSVQTRYALERRGERREERGESDKIG